MSVETRPVTQSAISVHVPVAILALALAVFLFSQQRNTNSQTEFMRFQRDNLEKQQEQLAKLETQLKTAFEERKASVVQAQQIQTVFQNMLSEVMRFADEGDADSKAIVQNWKIQRPPQPAAPGAAAPAGTPGAAPATPATPTATPAATPAGKGK